MLSSPPMKETHIRELLARALAWQDAHVSFDKAIAGIPRELRGRQPADLPYSPWQLLEHLRITQRDILDFCRNPHYKELEWPAEYWPSSPEPPSDKAWDESVRGFVDDRKTLQQLASDTSVDLDGKIPHGSGQTYLRELVLVVDHSAYHVGQLVLLRRLLGIWQ
jgi:uncharacterized damage-inducible protein DinB